MYNQYPPQYLTMQPTYPCYAHPSNAFYYPIWPNMYSMHPIINYIPGNHMRPNYQVMPRSYPNNPYNHIPHQLNNATNQFAAGNDTTCVEVWSDNQEGMLSRVKELARTYKVITFDTEIPGDPLGSNDNYRNATTDEAYDFIKRNVDCSNIISFG